MLTALSHGDATTGFEVIRRFIESLDLEKLSGAIIAMPCQNPVAFEWDSRNTPIDQSNMNRTYPAMSAVGFPTKWPMLSRNSARMQICSLTGTAAATGI